jgi:hypothetical protein
MAKVAGLVSTLAVPSTRHRHHRLPASRPGHNFGRIHLERVTTPTALPLRSIEELEATTPGSSIVRSTGQDGKVMNCIHANSMLLGSIRVLHWCSTRIVTCRQDWPMLMIQTTWAQASVLTLYLPSARSAVRGSGRARSTDIPQGTLADGAGLGYRARGSGPESARP